MDLIKGFYSIGNMIYYGLSADVVIGEAATGEFEPVKDGMIVYCKSGR